MKNGNEGTLDSGSNSHERDKERVSSLCLSCRSYFLCHTDLSIISDLI